MSKLLYSMSNEIYRMSHVMTLLDMQYYLQQCGFQARSLRGVPMAPACVVGHNDGQEN